MKKQKTATITLFDKNLAIALMSVLHLLRLPTPQW